MDYFLSSHNFFERLKEEYLLHKKLIVAFDFDDTVFDYHKKNRKYDLVIELLKECVSVGFILTLLTDVYEEKKSTMINELIKIGIAPDYINETPSFLPFGHCGKPYYNILLDDRAGLKEAYLALRNLVNMIKMGEI